MSTQFQGKTFGQKRPKLYQIIQKILKEYPSGQVFKEIIQNADDAGATEVKFFLDCRDLSTLPRELVNSSVHSRLDEFRGPALMTFNNAGFEDKDWDSIESLQQSEKAKNPHKVGKFGIGFNSVYHITDLPVIISGDNCGYLHPEEEIWKGESGKKFSLKDLQLNCPESIRPYAGIGGFSMQSPSFTGKTMFRFPLRNKPSKLSDTICTIDSIKQLLEALKAEAKYLLLFLRSVCSIEVIELSEFSAGKTLFKVSVSSCDGLKLQKQQKSLIDQVNLAFTESSPYSVESIIQEKFQFCIEIKDGESVKKHEWLVVHRVGSEDEEVLALAKQQHVLPWVGTASEVSQDRNETGGRIFCFLPLPIEDRAPFNVSVNGTFAVSSNRRSLNWESQERRKDSESKWNKYLVEKCIPQCYAELVQELIKLSSATPEIVYNCWPVLSLVQHTPWEGMLQPLFQKMLHSNSIVYTKADRGQWIALKNAVFVSEGEKFPYASLKSVLVSTGTNLVTLSSEQWSALKNYYNYSLQVITPSLVRCILKQHHNAYCNFLQHEKLEMLQYCLSDNCYSDLVGLELIPLANGSFGRFEKRGRIDDVYVCSTNIRYDLLPNLDDIMVDLLDDDTANHSLLDNIARSGKTQLTVLTVSAIAKLVPRSRQETWSQSELEMFWIWLQKRCKSLELFQNLSIVPVKNANREISIYCLRKQSGIVYLSPYAQLDPVLREGLEMYNVRMASASDFPYLTHPKLSSFLYSFEPGEVLDSLSGFDISSVELSDDQSLAIQTFLASSKNSIISRSRINTICDMSIFSVIQDRSNRYSINEIKEGNKAIAQGNGFLFDTNLLPSCPLIFEKKQPLLKSLASCVSVITGVKYLENIAFSAIKHGTFPAEQMTKFMTSVLSNLQTFIRQYPDDKKSLLSHLSSLPFVEIKSASRECPGSLFNPHFKILLKLFKGEPVFPSGIFTDYIDELRLCGLQGPTSITAEVMYELICSIQPNQSFEEIEKCTSITHTRILAFFDFLSHQCPDILNNVVSDGWYQSKLFDAISGRVKTHAILPIVSNKPNDYPPCLTWKGSMYAKSLACFDSTQVIVLPSDVNHRLPASYPAPKIIGSEIILSKAFLLQSVKNCYQVQRMSWVPV